MEWLCSHCCPPDSSPVLASVAVSRLDEPMTPRHRLFRSRISACVFIAAASIMGVASVSAGEGEDAFAREIRPLFNAKCAACHGGVKRAGGLSFLSREGTVATGKSGVTAVVPGDSLGSEMIRRVTSTDPDDRMPPPDHAPALTGDEINRLRRWIDQGAPWKQHWAYEKPISGPLPRANQSAWPRTDLDLFVLARMEKEGLSPSPEAGRLAWLRRVSFDLTGLPPSLEESRAFLADHSSMAHGRVVDRLLASARFGERWASAWLDLARYADTVGYERDPNRSAWMWRDWVVSALNDDIPYSEFLIKQIAGDLLPDPTMGDRLATAFQRNTQTNTECGSDDEEFRTLAVMDRIATTWEGLMATSFRCVQCHDHPYDPFKHEEFYRFAALLNTSRDNDSAEDFPHLAVPVRVEDWSRAEALDRAMRQRRQELHGAGMALAEKSSWQPLRATAATSNGNATIQLLERDGAPEVHITGVITLSALYTLEFPAPGAWLTALRIDALPFDPAKAASVSELGFVLSYLKMELVTGGKTSEIPLAGTYDDDPDSFYAAEASLNDDLPGWSAYPRINRPRRAVFVTAEPVSLPPGSVVRLTLQTKAQSTGITAQMLRRGRFAISGDTEWTELFKRQIPAREAVAALRTEREAMKSVPVPVMIEQSSVQRRETHVFNRGNFLDRGAPVEPGVPEVLGGGLVSNRLDLARWMTTSGHPLTARAAVNRFWHQLFGHGLVESVEDFGSSGQPPSHPELFDWLAVRFSTTLGWSQKKLLREIVLSATYRQDARVTPGMLERDPDNRWLTRGPRSRLSAEMIRDQALAVSGLLSDKIGGPPVMPPQPEGIWRTVYNGGKWVTSPGEDRHRRAIYTFIRRTSGYPSFLTFDAPSRDVCAVRRIPTNTPLQALVTLNDPVYIEAAAALADRMAAAGPLVERQLSHGHELVTGRPPVGETLQPLVALHTLALDRFKNDTGASELFAGPPARSALTVVANALLNLDVALTK